MLTTAWMQEVEQPMLHLDWKNDQAPLFERP